MRERRTTRHINEILAQRGILESWERAGLKPQGNGCQYPIFDLRGQVIGHRFKRISGHPKYFWQPEKPDHEMADWYILPGTAQAISGAGGVCYLANGEPSLHAYHTASVYNTICTTLSEISVPSNTLDILRRLGVSRLVYPVDNDKAGFDSAIKWRDALRGSGIDFEAQTWGDNKKPGYDANDLWMDCEFSEALFQQKLSELQTLELPAPAEKPKTNYEHIDITDDLIEAIRHALRDHLTGRSFKNGEWLQMRCIHHDDTHASAGLNILSGVVNCHVCGGHSPYETAEQLGIDWRSFYPERPKPDYTPKLTRVQQIDIAAKLKADWQAAKAVLPKPQNRPIIEFPDLLFEAEKQRCRDLHHDWLNNHLRYYSPLNKDESPVSYLSWWDCDDIPLSHLSAIMTLQDTRSNTALVLGRMHMAFRNGSLAPSVFSIPLVADAIKMSVRSVTNAFIELERGGYIRFLATCSIYSILYSSKDMSQQTGVTPYHNMTPARLFTIVEETDDISERLYKQLEIYWTEKIHGKGFAKMTRQMAEDMGVEDYATFQQMQAWSELVEQDKLSRQDAKSLRIELHGDGKDGGWRGWKLALRMDFAFAIDWFECETIKDVRGAILTQWIGTEKQSSLKRMARLLGCSTTTVGNIMRDFEIASDRQVEAIVKKADFDDLAPVRNALAQEHEAAPIDIQFRYKDGKHFVSRPLNLVRKIYQEERYKIKEVKFVMNAASLRRPMTEDEIRAKQDAETTPMEREIEKATSADKSQPATEAKTETVIASHVYTHHTPEFLQHQLEKAVWVLTDCTLLQDAIMGYDGEVVYQAKEGFKDIVNWICKNRADKPLFKLTDFHGIEDYDDLVNKRYQQEREAELKLLEDGHVRLATDKALWTEGATPKLITQRALVFHDKHIDQWGNIHKVCGDVYYINDIEKPMTPDMWGWVGRHYGLKQQTKQTA